jgi:hypothetical protein
VKQHDTLMRRLAVAMVHIAMRLLPGARAEWARAMLAELHYLKSDRQAFVWALGCSFAAIRERANTMITGNLKISPWILGPEMLLCFVPLSIGWRDAVFGGAGITRLSTEVIQQYFIGVPGGRIALAMMIAGAILGLLGPLGLVAAFRLVVLDHALRIRWLRVALVAGPLLYGALTLVFRFAMGGLVAFSINAVDAFDYWSGLLLLSVLPAAGAAHLFLNGPTLADKPAVA